MLLVGILSMNSFAGFKFLEKLFGRRDFVQPEKLTNERAREILGNYANHVVMYNFDTRKWNRCFYLGHSVMLSGVDCYNMRQKFERLKPDLELVAVVGMAIKEPSLKTHVYLPEPASIHDKKPLAYATFITRNRVTGKLNELPQKWVMLSECAGQAFVCEAMPQLLSGIGYSTAKSVDVDWCLDGHKITDPLISAKECEKYRDQIRNDMTDLQKKR